MSLLNDALRKKNKENRSSGGAPSLPMGSRISSGNKTKVYLIALVLISAGILGGLAAIHFIYLSPKLPVKPLNMTPRHITEKKSLHKTDPSEIAQKKNKTRAKNEVKLQQPAAVEIKGKVKGNETGILKPDNKIENAPLNTINAVLLKKEKTIVKRDSPIKKNIKKLTYKKGIKKVRAKYNGEKTADLFFQKGLSYHRQGSLDKAVKMYEEVLKKNPQHTGALFNLSAVYLAESSFSEAWTVLEKLVKQDPENPLVLINCAIAKIGLGDSKQALSFLEAAEKQKNAPQFMIYFHRGIAYSHLKNLSEALFWYKKAENLRPNHSRLVFNMALAYDKMQNYQGALKYYSKYLHYNKVSSNEKIELEKRLTTLKAYQIKPFKKVSDKP